MVSSASVFSGNPGPYKYSSPQVLQSSGAKGERAIAPPGASMTARVETGDAQSAPTAQTPYRVLTAEVAGCIVGGAAVILSAPALGGALGLALPMWIGIGGAAVLGAASVCLLWTVKSLVCIERSTALIEGLRAPLYPARSAWIVPTDFDSPPACVLVDTSHLLEGLNQDHGPTPLANTADIRLYVDVRPEGSPDYADLMPFFFTAFSERFRRFAQGALTPPVLEGGAAPSAEPSLVHYSDASRISLANYLKPALLAFCENPENPLPFVAPNLKVAAELLDYATAWSDGAPRCVAQPIINSCERLLRSSQVAELIAGGAAVLFSAAALGASLGFALPLWTGFVAATALGAALVYPLSTVQLSVRLSHSVKLSTCSGPALRSARSARNGPVDFDVPPPSILHGPLYSLETSDQGSQPLTNPSVVGLDMELVSEKSSDYAAVMPFFFSRFNERSDQFGQPPLTRSSADSSSVSADELSYLPYSKLARRCLADYLRPALVAFCENPKNALAFVPPNLEVAAEILDWATAWSHDAPRSIVSPIIEACEKLVRSSHAVQCTRALIAAGSRSGQPLSDEIFVRTCALLSTCESAALQWMRPFGSWLLQHPMWDDVLLRKLSAVVGEDFNPGARLFGGSPGVWSQGPGNGYNVIIFSDGSRYEGLCKNGESDGYGILVSADGSRYEGSFKDGKYDGHGTFRWADGSRYEGIYKNGKRYHGITTGKDGSRHEGAYRDGKRNGYGVSDHQGHHYEGYFRDNNHHGYGTYTWPDGSQYEGDFEDCEHHGQGVYTWLNGDRYEGGHRLSYLDGRGILTISDGSRYEQEWTLNYPKVNKRVGRLPEIRDFRLEMEVFVDVQDLKKVWRLGQIIRVADEEVEVRFVGFGDWSEIIPIGASGTDARLAMRDTKSLLL